VKFALFAKICTRDCVGFAVAALVAVCPKAALAPAKTETITAAATAMGSSFWTIIFIPALL
jgi:hypothetical protein